MLLLETDKDKRITSLAKVIIIMIIIINYRPETGKDQHYDDFNHAKHFFRFEFPLPRFFVLNVTYQRSDEPRLK